MCWIKILDQSSDKNVDMSAYIKAFISWQERVQFWQIKVVEKVSQVEGYFELYT